MSDKILESFFAGLRPEKRLTVWEWADKYRRLSSVVAAEPGRYRTDRAPYLREIMAKLSVHDPTEEIIVMKGAQLGLTEVGFNFLGYIIHTSPAPAMYVMPTEDTLKFNSKYRFDPMVEATPVLQNLVAAKNSRDRNNTTTEKQFDGGVLSFAGANSPAGLRSKPVRFLILDEIDEYPKDLKDQGSPIELAIKRTATFNRRKIYKLSTPTIHKDSAIELDYNRTDQRRFFVPCPYCHHFQTLEFEGVKWESEEKRSAVYFCEGCGGAIEERLKKRMLADGEWRVTNPDGVNIRVVGYHISSLYSPLGWYSWAEALRDWEASETDINKRKTFVNTVLGETFKEASENFDWNVIYQRRENYEIGVPPSDCVILTAGIDVQKDRLEMEVVGWCAGMRSYSVDYKVIEGDVFKDEVWQKLRNELMEEYTREDGRSMRIRCSAVDTGYASSRVYQFLRSAGASVIGVKGYDNMAMALGSRIQPDRDKKGRGVKVGGAKVYKVGSSFLKEELYGNLRLQPSENGEYPPRYCHFPQYAKEYFRGLVGEEQRLKENGRYEWVKTYERNEPLDCRNYARAAATHLNIPRRPAEWWEKHQNKPF